MKDWGSWLLVIPARLGSSRLAEKPLIALGSKTLIERVYDRVKVLGAKTVVATDHPKIFSLLSEKGIPVKMTRNDHLSGTDRVRETVEHYDYPLVMNVQGDEPLVSLEGLENLRSLAEKRGAAFSMGTLVYHNYEPADYSSPHCVKCVFNTQGQAMYFSRSAMPHYRDSQVETQGFWQHLGVYAFSREALFRFAATKPSPLEEAEKLEQLRALENGMEILVAESPERGIGIDTIADWERARAMFKD